MSEKRRQDLVYPPGPEAEREQDKQGHRLEAEIPTTTGRLFTQLCLVRHDEEAILRVLRHVPRIDRLHARIALFQALGGQYTNAGPRALALCERVFGSGTMHFPSERQMVERKDQPSPDTLAPSRPVEREPKPEPAQDPEAAFDQGRIQILCELLKRLVSQPPFPPASEILALLDAAESHVATAVLSRLNYTLLPGEDRYGRTYYKALQQAAGENVSDHLTGRRDMLERMLPGWHKAGRPKNPPPLPLETRLLNRGARLGVGQLLGSWDKSVTAEAKAKRHTEAEERLAEDHPALAVLGQGGGERLPEAVHGRMGRLFGHDFSHVRIHTDASAAEVAELLGARALALGTHIYFGAGQFAPGTPAGDRLLAHELVHVVQFDEGRLPAARGAGLEVSRPEDGAEREAEARTQSLHGQPHAHAHGGSVHELQQSEHGDDVRRTSSPSRPSESFRYPQTEPEADRIARLIPAGEPTPAVRERTAAVVLRDLPDGGAPMDAGESLPGGVPPTAQEIEEARLRDTEPAALPDADLGPAIEHAQSRGDTQRVNTLIGEIDRRHRDDRHFGVGLPSAIPRGTAGNALVTPEIALAMVENMVSGHPPFRPELGVGGASWFVTEGNPYTGVSTEHTIPVQAELVGTQGGLRFEQADLDRMFAEEEARARPDVEAQVRARFRIRTGRDTAAQLSRTLSDKVARQLRGLAERRMWERVGRTVAASGRRVGEVILEARARDAPGRPAFSNNAGRFTVVADASKIRLRGGLRALLDTIRASPSVRPVPELEQSAEALARTLRLAGRVRSVLRVGGKILLFVAIANDILQVIIAEDHLEATLVSLSGWAGASAGAAAFSALWTPADTAGPWAWAVHGVGALVAGGFGYWVGSNTTRYVYRLVVQNSGQVRTE